MWVSPQGQEAYKHNWRMYSYIVIIQRRSDYLMEEGLNLSQPRFARGKLTECSENLQEGAEETLMQWGMRVNICARGGVIGLGRGVIGGVVQSAIPSS